MTMVRKIAGVCARMLYGMVQKAGQHYVSGNGPIVLAPQTLAVEDKAELIRRLNFYTPAQADHVSFQSTLSTSDLCSARAILVFENPDFQSSLSGKLREGVFNVDFRRNPTDAWAWCKFSRYVATHRPNLGDSQQRLISYVNRLKSQHLQKCYIFGTGISLAKAIERDWSDGYRVVCNTIVRDAKLWKHINPDFIVAGDALYHFGFTDFARTFRRDLARRLGETGTYFVYADEFHEIVRRELSEFSDQLIPIPEGAHQRIRIDLTEEFQLSNAGNVLNCLLLPLASTLSKTVCMWGFDGRAPHDKLFWANSSQHSYPELMNSLIEAHPAFFEHFVPSSNPGKYAKTVHGDELDSRMSIAEQEGWRFIMMHKSWTQTLQKRFVDEREIKEHCHNYSVSKNAPHESAQIVKEMVISDIERFEEDQ